MIWMRSKTNTTNHFCFGSNDERRHFVKLKIIKQKIKCYFGYHRTSFNLRQHDWPRTPIECYSLCDCCGQVLYGGSYGHIHYPSKHGNPAILCEMLGSYFSDYKHPTSEELTLFELEDVDSKYDLGIYEFYTNWLNEYQKYNK